MEKKNITTKLILIFLFALVIRIAFILTLDNTVDVWGDWWDELGLKIATGQGFWVNNPYFAGGEHFYSWRPPGFPLFLACIYRLFGHSYLYAKIGIAVLSAFNCVLLFFLAAGLLKKERTALWCALVYAVYPPAIFWTGYIAPVTNEIFLMLLIMLFLIKWEKDGKRSYLLAGGFLTGFAALTRSNFLILIPAVFLWFFVKRRDFLWKGFGIYFAACLMLLSPWIIRNYRIHKTFMLTSTEGGVVCYIANNESALSLPTGYLDPVEIESSHIMEEINGLSEVEIDRYFYNLALVFIKDNPVKYVRLVMGRFERFWRPAPHTFSGPGESYKSYHVIIAMVTNIPIFLLGIFGFIFSLKRWRDFSLFYMLIVFWSVPIILLFKTIIRYREPLMPFIIIFACLSVQFISAIYKKGKNM